MNQTSITPGVPIDAVVSAKITDRAALISVRLISFSGTVKPIPDTVKQFDIGFECSTKIEINEQAHRIAVLAKIQVSVNKHRDPQTPTTTSSQESASSNDAEITVEHAIVYQINSFEGLTEADYGIFANTSGLFHAWPFWREFVQNMSIRMGLPPIVLPLFRVLPVPPATINPPKKAKSKSKTSS